MEFRLAENYCAHGQPTSFKRICGSTSSRRPRLAGRCARSASASQVRGFACLQAFHVSKLASIAAAARLLHLNISEAIQSSISIVPLLDMPILNITKYMRSRPKGGTSTAIVLATIRSSPANSTATATVTERFPICARIKLAEKGALEISSGLRWITHLSLRQVATALAITVEARSIRR